MSTTREPGQELAGGYIDPHFGVVVPLTKKEIVATGDETSPSVSIAGSIVSGVEIEPKTRFIAERTKRNITLPPDQVWYERRREQFPPVLGSIVIRGTETKEAAINYVTVPEGLLWARNRRHFSFGPPVDSSLGLAFLFDSQPFLDYIEFDETTHHTTSNASIRNGTETNSGTFASTQDSTSAATSTRQHTSDSNGTHSNTHVSNDASTHVTSQDGTHQSADTTARTTHHDSTTQQTGNDQQSFSHNSTTAEAGHIDGAVLVSDPVVNRLSAGTGASTTQRQSTNHVVTNAIDTGTGTSSGTSTTTSNGNATNAVNGTGSGTAVNHETATLALVTNHISHDVVSGTRSGNTTSISNGTESGNGALTRKALLRIELRPCLRVATVVTVGSNNITIPATTPVDLPWGHWIEVARNSGHWLDGVWTTETVEVFLPPKTYGI